MENPMCAAFGYVLILLKGCTRGIFHGGDTHVWVLLPEDIWNWSPSFRAFFLRKETPSPFPNGCLADGFPDLP